MLPKNEIKTVNAMIRIYCSENHLSNNSICSDCENLFEYVITRIDKCKFKPQNIVCSECIVHCFQPEMREKIKNIMRYSGPKMIWKHPILAMRHLKNKILSKIRIKQKQ